MIKSDRQARLVQERRYKAGKAGIAKAVRRYFLRTYGRTVQAQSLPHRFPDPSGA